MEVWVLTYEIYDYDCFNPVIALFRNKEKGLAMLLSMIEKDDDADKPYKLYLDTDDQITYNNGNYTGDIAFTLESKILPREAEEIKLIAYFSVRNSNFWLPTEILMEINKYLCNIWVLIGQGFNYGDNGVVISLYRKKEDAMKEQLSIIDDDYEEMEDEMKEELIMIEDGEKIEDNIISYHNDSTCITIIKQELL